MPDFEFRLTDVRKSYCVGKIPLHVLNGVSVEIVRGERVALLGRSGSGKSTLLNLLGGLDQLSGGSIEAGGRRLDVMSAREMAHYRRSVVGMIFQGYNLLPTKTALENVAVPALLAGIAKRTRHDMAERALNEVGLGGRLHHRPTELSGGEQQRVAIARALANQPRVLLADEPTGNLDSATANDVIQVIDRLTRQRSMTVILVTHDEELATQFSDRILHIVDGRLETSADVRLPTAPGRDDAAERSTGADPSTVADDTAGGPL